MHVRGIRIGEHPDYGGVSAGHMSGSWHYKGSAADLNWGSPGAPESERAVLIWAARVAEARGLNAIYSYWRPHPTTSTRNAHYDHLHVDVGYTYGFPEMYYDSDRYADRLYTPVSGWSLQAHRISTIKQGDDNAEWRVRLWQRFLIKTGDLPSGEADGVFGPMTADATRDWQQRANLVADGIVGPKTWFRACYGVEPGDEGVRVEIAQRVLGLTGEEVDGVAGPTYTTLAKRLQRWLGETMDAKLGPDTISKLLRFG